MLSGQGWDQQNKPLHHSMKPFHFLFPFEGVHILFHFPGQRGVWIIDLLLAGLTTEVWVCICCRDKSKEMAEWLGEPLSRALTMHLIYKQGEGIMYGPSVNRLMWHPHTCLLGNQTNWHRLRNSTQTDFTGDFKQMWLWAEALGIIISY